MAWDEGEVNKDFNGEAGETFEDCMEMHKGMLVNAIAYAKRKYPDLMDRPDEIEQAMTIKLWDAWRNFNPELGWRFSTYAHQAMYRQMPRACEEIMGIHFRERTTKIPLGSIASLDAPAGEGDAKFSDFVEDRRDDGQESAGRRRAASELVGALPDFVDDGRTAAFVEGKGRGRARMFRGRYASKGFSVRAHEVALRSAARRLIVDGVVEDSPYIDVE